MAMTDDAACITVGGGDDGRDMAVVDVVVRAIGTTHQTGTVTTAGHLPPHVEVLDGGIPDKLERRDKACVLAVVGNGDMKGMACAIEGAIEGSGLELADGGADREIAVHHRIHERAAGGGLHLLDKGHPVGLGTQHHVVAGIGGGAIDVAGVPRIDDLRTLIAARKGAARLQ